MKVEGTDSVANVSGEGTAADDHQRKRRRKKAFMIRDILGEKDEDDEEKEDDEEEPVDLSSSASPGKDQEDKAPSSPSPKLPAWIFCTRYSDRPSAGKLLCFCRPLPAVIKRTHSPPPPAPLYSGNSPWKKARFYHLSLRLSVPLQS